MNKKDILFFNKKLKYTFHKSTPTTQFVQSSEETVQWHKLWQLLDTNLPRQLQYINVFHQKKNKLWETLSQVLFVESNHLNYPPHSTSRLQLMPPTQNSSSSTSLDTCSNESQYTCFIVGYGRRWHFGCKLWWFILWL